MTPIGHDPYRSHVPGSTPRIAQETSEPRMTTETADDVTSMDLACWAAVHPGGAAHVLATVDALAGI